MQIDNQDAILDQQGLLCDPHQLRLVAHSMTLDIQKLLLDNPGLLLTLGEAYYLLLAAMDDIHAVVCESREVSETPTPVVEASAWRLFTPTED